MRNTAEQSEEKKEVIEIAPEWMEQLAAFPFKSSKFIILSLTLIGKGGRTMALLKKGSKKRDNDKKRKEVPTLGTFKDYVASKKKPVVLPSKIPGAKGNHASNDK